MSHCKVWVEDSAVICAKTAELIEMLIGLLSRMGRGNHVLDEGGPAVLRDVAMATNFGTQFATTSDTLFDTRGEFSGSSYPTKT